MNLAENGEDKKEVKSSIILELFDMKDSLTKFCEGPRLNLQSIKQYYIPVEREEWKIEVIIDIYGNLDFLSAVIYCNSK